MKILHILKSEPDETVEKLCDVISRENDASVVSLYQGKPDWHGLVDQIYSHDKVICWW